MMFKVRCLFCLENCTTEGRGGEKEGSANFQKSTQNLDIINSWLPVLHYRESGFLLWNPLFLCWSQGHHLLYSVLSYLVSSWEQTPEASKVAATIGLKRSLTGAERRTNLWWIFAAPLSEWTLRWFCAVYQQGRTGLAIRSSFGLIRVTLKMLTIFCRSLGIMWVTIT